MTAKTTTARIVPGDPRARATTLRHRPRPGREATEDSNTPDGDKCIGTGSKQTSIPRDCGDRVGRLDMKFGWDYSTRKNYMRLGGHYQSFTVGTLANFVPPMGSGDALGNTYRNCGFWAPTVSNPGVDELLEAEEPVKPKRILALKKGTTAIRP